MVSSKTKSLFTAGTIFVTITWLVAYLLHTPNDTLTLVFCDVGQGDGIYINLPNGDDVVIDGGPNDKILQCLGKNMPFWDRTIEIVVLTHAQSDHLNGLIPLLKRYDVDYFISSPIGNTTKGYQQLTSLIKEKGIPVKNLYAGDTIKIPPVSLRALWPSKEYIASKIDPRKSAIISANHGSVLGASTSHSDLNDFSLVLELNYGEFQALLTGDADEEIQDDIMRASTINPVEIFKVPHHGSKYGILEEYLDKANPKHSIVSVGKNRWGHPTEEIIHKLEIRNTKLYRTDRQGDITIISDGNQYKILTAND